MLDTERLKIPRLREVIVLVLVALPLLVTVSTIEAAHWVKGLPSLKVLVLVSIVMWALLARSALPWWIGHSVALLLGLGVAFVLGAFTIAETSGLADLAALLGAWFGAIGSAEGDTGTATTAMVLIAVTLWMGHATVWLAYRRSAATLSALPGMGVLLVVLTFLPSDYYWYFFIYLLAAAPGIAYRYRGRWSIRGERVPLLGTLVAGLVLMAVTLAPVWRAPTPEGTIFPLVSKFEKPWYSFRDRWSNLFYGVPNRQVWPAFSLPDDLHFAGPIEPGPDLPYWGAFEQGKDVLFVVESQQPHRWRMRVYDTYTDTGWRSARDPIEVDSTGPPLQGYVDGLKDRKKLEIGVRIYSKTNTLVSVGEPLAAGIPFKAELSPQPGFDLYLEDSQVSYLPPEVGEYRDEIVSVLTSSEGGDLSQTRGTDPLIVPQDKPASTLPSVDLVPPEGFHIARTLETAPEQLGPQPQEPRLSYIQLERSEPILGPPVALLGQRPLVPPRQYRTVGSISQASPGMLVQAGRDYPDWIADRYLQLPNDFPETVRDLARELTLDEQNPYDMALAIRRHLVKLPYSLDVKLPPKGQDWVEFFLLDQRRGYCQNYASAMITMLRSLGVPSRLVVGFAPGVRDRERGVWEVQSRHYHAWPEVFFPEYGWVEFEPTPADVQNSLQELGYRPQGGLVTDFSDFDDCDDDFEFCDGPIPTDGQLGEITFDDVEDQAEASPASGDSDGGVLGTLSSSWTLVGVALALVVVVPMGVGLYTWRGILRMGYPTAAYASMCFLGRLAGVVRRPQDTPWEYCSRLTQVCPDRTEAITGVTRGFVTARYGPSKELASEDMDGMREAWRTVRRALFGRILLRLVPYRG